MTLNALLCSTNIPKPEIIQFSGDRNTYHNTVLYESILGVHHMYFFF